MCDKLTQNSVVFSGSSSGFLFRYSSSYFCHSMACTRVCVVVLGLLLLLRVFCIIFRISCQVAVKFAWNGFLNAANSDSNNYIFEKWVLI